MVRFRTKKKANLGDQSFIQSYLEVIRDRESPEKASEWLFANFSKMNQKIFFDPGWENIGPLELLILRVCSPIRVFTLTAKGAFLTNIQDNPLLSQIAEAAFGNSDCNFLSNLPSECKQYRSKLKALMRIAYDNNIRAEDPNVFR